MFKESFLTSEVANALIFTVLFLGVWAFIESIQVQNQSKQIWKTISYFFVLAAVIFTFSSTSAGLKELEENISIVKTWSNDTYGVSLTDEQSIELYGGGAQFPDNSCATSTLDKEFGSSEVSGYTVMLTCMNGNYKLVDEEDKELPLRRI